MDPSKSKYYYTSCLMDDALLALLEKKDYEFITVQELCKKAGVHRSTFYLHYEKMDDLLLETIQKIQKDFFSSFHPDFSIKESIVKGKKEDLFLIQEEYLLVYLDFICKNKKVYRLMHEKPEIFQLKNIFSKMYQDIFSPILSIFEVEEKKQPYYLAYYLGGVFSIIEKWVELGFSMSKEEVASLVMEVVPKARKEEK